MEEESTPFGIRPGIYMVPDIGRVVATGRVAEAMQVRLYLSPFFPFISLKEDGVELLKKEKLSAKQVSALILRSKTVEEIDLLLKVKSNKALKGIADTKKLSLVR